MFRKVIGLLALTMLLVAALAACGTPTATLTTGIRELPANVGPVAPAETNDQEDTAQESAPAPDAQEDAAPAAQGGEVVKFTLETTMENGLAFKGIGGEIDGVINPELKVPAGATVEITLVNGDGMLHDVMFDTFDAATPQFAEQGATETITFVASESGTFEYYCSVPGHKQAGMVGKLIVEGDAPAVAHDAADHGAGDAEAPAPVGVEHAPAVADAPVLAADPNLVPAPIGDRAAQTVVFDIETTEVVGKLADGTTFEYWTFNNTVPGPILRVREGDTVVINLTNRGDSAFAHSIDLHAATGYHGGGSATQIAPGETKSFTFKALNPGVFVYHCATPMVAHHIANGMYGLIIVEPAGGLPPVDREFYVMQGEIYSAGNPGDTGHLEFDVDLMIDENPNYLVFNGSVGALNEDLALRAKQGETIRIWMGVGGPNLTSSFHVIGEVFDRVYSEGSLTSPPLTHVQTTLVPAGGATMVEFKLEQPGNYVLVDHSLSRAVKGLSAALIVEGELDDAISSGSDNH